MNAVGTSTPADTAKAEILARVRAAVGDVNTSLGARGPVPRVEFPTPERHTTIELFVENVVDYRAEVVRADDGQVGTAVAVALDGAGSVVVPAGLDPAWTAALPAQIRQVRDDELSHAELDQVEAVITAASVGIATTGTIVLDHGPDQGRRALSLVPDLHVCVIRADQVVHDVPEAVARVRPQVGSAQPFTWISGPSATSDIELERVEGVHGPRILHVVLVE
ncbi:MAG: lactate utilization protein C [Actinomycetales bacterium]|nr:MAG: lactate utilization protein C [Actinomycetales bacterium]